VTAGDWHELRLNDGRTARWLVRHGAHTVHVNVVGGPLDGCSFTADRGRTWVLVESHGNIVDHETLEFRQGPVIDGYTVWRSADVE
jgi:hypothetical protein